MLRKIRFGQLQRAALSGHGVGEIFPPARILETPFLFRTHAEIDAVRATIQPAIDAGFRANQYELLAWMEVGNIHHPVHLGIVILANLEIGYLTSPVGINLYLASQRFKRPVLAVFRAALPF